VVRPATAATSKRCSTSAPISIRVPRSATKAKIQNRTARPHANAEYARQSRIDPTPKRYPPSFRKFSTRAVPVSSKQSARSNDSSASHCVVRRHRGITVRSSRWQCIYLDQNRPHGLTALPPRAAGLHQQSNENEPFSEKSKCKIALLVPACGAPVFRPTHGTLPPIRAARFSRKVLWPHSRVPHNPRLVADIILASALLASRCISSPRR
jgi:hypothetical protein